MASRTQRLRSFASLAHSRSRTGGSGSPRSMSSASALRTCDTTRRRSALNLNFFVYAEVGLPPTTRLHALRVAAKLGRRLINRVADTPRVVGGEGPQARARAVDEPAPGRVERVDHREQHVA